MYYDRYYKEGEMPMSVRLDPGTEALLRRVAKAAGKSRSWVVREAVTVYASAAQPRRKLADVLGPFIGAGATGRTDLSQDTGRRYADLIRARSGRRRAR
jgi:hypothetical protein